MDGQSEKKRIFISACEPSGEEHCAKLIKALKKRACGGNETSQEIEFVGVGGIEMAGAGCKLMENTADKATMIYNAFARINYYKKLLGRIKAYFAENRVDLVIVCDSPAFNFHVAKIASKHHIKVLFYVAPQLWAWARWRLRKLRRLCDRLACILPFEQDWFAGRGIDATYVGNPLFDDTDVGASVSCKEYADFNPRALRIAILPGSREAEIKKLWPAMQKIALRLVVNHPMSQFKVCAVTDDKLRLLKDKQYKAFECDYVTSGVIDTARWADLALVASGSATLQVAAAACPMIIMYQSSRVMWYLFGCWLVRTRFLSLVNILAGREVVPEFMPYFGSITPIVDKCNELIANKIKLTTMSRELVDLARPLIGRNASQTVANMALEMLEEKEE
jgi:lipid-A-disaccharide synthase